MISHKVKQFESVTQGLLVRAPAKINLSLLIAGKRPDGFHEIETIMAKVNFYDEILIQRRIKSGIELICNGPHWAPETKENLIYKAAEILLKEFDSKANIKITLTKNIPAGSGLGSASSDAAAALLGLNHFLNLKAEPQQLKQIASALGSDVPFFLSGPLSFCTGKGEKIKKIKEIFNFSALLVLPDITISTKSVYANYTHNLARYEGLHNRINALLEKNRIDLASEMCANMLQDSCFSLYEKLAELKTNIESSGIGPLCLSGSGSAMFYIIDNREKTQEYTRILREKFGCKSIIVNNNRW